MYSNKLVVAIKANGKILREFDDVVALPFGTEYSILVKNLGETRVRFTVTIDGESATEDLYVLCEPGKEVELQRFIKNGNLQSGNAFKFIERTSKIEKHRGIRAEDGLVRIEYEFEVRSMPVNRPDPIPYSYKEWPWPSQGKINRVDSSSYTYSNSGTDEYAQYSAQCSVASNVLRSASAGVTAPGSRVDQTFSMSNKPFLSDGKNYTIVLKLVGETKSGAPVVQPVTVKTPKVCPMCGTHCKYKDKFCKECGSALDVIA